MFSEQKFDNSLLTAQASQHINNVDILMKLGLEWEFYVQDLDDHGTPGLIEHRCLTIFFPGGASYDLEADGDQVFTAPMSLNLRDCDDIDDFLSVVPSLDACILNPNDKIYSNYSHFFLTFFKLSGNWEKNFGFKKIKKQLYQSCQLEANGNPVLLYISHPPHDIADIPEFLFKEHHTMRQNNSVNRLPFILNALKETDDNCEMHSYMVLVTLNYDFKIWCERELQKYYMCKNQVIKVGGRFM